MDQVIDGLIAIKGPIGTVVYLAVMVFFIAATVCSFLCMVCPVPGPGSRWVVPRQIASWLALNRGYAMSRLLPGTLEAAATLSDIIAKAEANHAEAEAGRAAIVAVLGPVPGKLADIQGRVTNLAVITAQVKP